MCGICGALHLSGGRVVPEVVDRMRDTMVHRGPDDLGRWASDAGTVAMGHRRLSIVDLTAAGRGPMSNENGRVWLSFNGEIYNHRQLRKEIEDRHSFRSNTDTEVILHLYEERGLDVLHSLRGMFALSLWDEDRRRLLLARDRVGEKPLYHVEVDGQLIWASEIKALLAHPSVRPDLDEESLSHYLSYGAVPAPRTLLRGISKLPPGHMLVCEAGQRPTVSRWWSPLDAAARSGPLRDEQAAILQLRELLTDSVTERTMADVPHGLFLSGGVDSSLVLSILTAALGRSVRTFSIGFEEQPRFDERRIAADVAQRFAADHTEVVLSPREAREAVPELVFAQDEPLSDWVCIPLMMLARAVRKAGTVVVQVGEGSDELFAGYPRYRRYAGLNGVWDRYMRVPQSLRRLASTVVSPTLGSMGSMREPADLFYRAARNEPLFVNGAVAHWEREKEGLLTEHGRAIAARHPSSAALAGENQADYWRTLPQGDYAGAMGYQDLMIRLPELLLMRVDKMTMLSSVEARVPFLDHRVVELAFSIPQDFKIRDGRTKHILKEAAGPLLGSDIIDRPKIGFDVPLASWLRERELGGWAEETVMESKLLEREIFDRDALRHLFRSHADERADFGYRIWNLVNLAAWYDHWVA